MGAIALRVVTGDDVVMDSEVGDRLIGFFDSGVGGLSVWREVITRLPNSRTLYLADSAHCPYGARSTAEITDFSRAIARFLIRMGADLIVVACNTASAAALTALRREFPIPFVGMEPAVKPAAERTRSGHVGVLATAGTLNGGLFRSTSARYTEGVVLHVQEGEGLVELVEAGETESAAAEALLRRYITPMLSAGVDQIALGCTHYPLLLPLLRRMVPDHVTIIDPADAVARQVERVLGKMPLVGPRHAETDPSAAEPQHRFFSTGSGEVLNQLADEIAGQHIFVAPMAWNEKDLELVGRQP
jgi:glutamate racemase